MVMMVAVLRSGLNFVQNAELFKKSIIELMNAKSLANLRPAKKGERRALKPADQRKTLILAGRVTPSNMSKANKLIKTTGSKTKAINHLLENYEK